MSPCSAQDLPSSPNCSPVETSPVPTGLTGPHNCWPTLLCDCITPSRDLLMTFVGLWAKLARGQKQHLVHSFRGVSTVVGAPQLQEGDVQRVAGRRQRTSGNAALQTKTYPLWPYLLITATQLPETMPPAGKQGFHPVGDRPGVGNLSHC